MEESSDHAAWKEWFQHHGSRLLLCARQWTQNVSDAEDVLQDAFVRFWRHQRALGGDPLGLVLTSIRRAAYDHARQNQRRLRRETRAEEKSVEPSLFEPEDTDDDRRRAIEAALQTLPTEQREVLVMKIWGERTFEQIAHQLGISPNTAASRYRYALGTLRKELSATNHHV